MVNIQSSVATESSTWHAVDSCRSCGSPHLTTILSLGQTPLANSLIDQAHLNSPEAVYPLTLSVCTNCSLVQILETVSPEVLFRDYMYFSSFSDTMLTHSRDLTERLVAERNLNSSSLVVEIASNDGYLLQHYVARGIAVLGIEPAANVAKVAQSKGVDTLCEFFTADLSAALAADGKRADVIHANNVLAHVNDINGFVQGISTLLKDNGIAVIETPYLKNLLDNVEFDTIYHEHIFYYSLTALDQLFRRHGLVIWKIEQLPIHGGSLRILAAKSPCAAHDSVADLLAEERAWGVSQPSSYQDFARRVIELRQKLTTLLGELKSGGKSIAVYGASAKGSTLLNFFGIGKELLDFVVDRSTVKQGRFTPGTRLPIYPPERLLEVMPDYVLLLTWNFAEEILAQQGEYIKQGGRFIVPIPSVRVI